MPSIGPTLPPHLLAKRKRKAEEASNEQKDSAVHVTQQQSPSSDKRRRVAGPTLPPAPIEEKPSQPADSDSDSDDYGPTLPSAGLDTAERADAVHETRTDEDTTSTAAPDRQRDEWMTMAPKQDDLAARMDPSRLRARGFNTGRAARSGGQEDTTVWHETAEQKQKRLAAEVLGISTTRNPASGEDNHERRSGLAKKIPSTDEREGKPRGPSLLAQHQQHKGEEAEDDPSKRAFDREKDMSSASRIGGAQKREMLNKASDYSSRFSKATYL